jgi:hypothetical protein
MKANLELDEEQMKIAAEEEKKRRRKLRVACGPKLMDRRCYGPCSHFWSYGSRSCWYHPVSYLTLSVNIADFQSRSYFMLRYRVSWSFLSEELELIVVTPT